MSRPCMKKEQRELKKTIAKFENDLDKLDVVIENLKQDLMVKDKKKRIDKFYNA